MKQLKRKRGIINLFKCSCPRCREGKKFVYANPWLLTKTMKMNDECPLCKQPFNIEPGFYYGTGFVSYALAVAGCLVTFTVWFFSIGFSLNDNRILKWLIFNAVFLLVLQPYLMRLSRTLWLLFFVSYDPNWPTMPPQSLEKINKSQENNW